MQSASSDTAFDVAAESEQLEVDVAPAFDVAAESEQLEVDVAAAWLLKVSNLKLMWLLKVNNLRLKVQ